VSTLGKKDSTIFCIYSFINNVRVDVMFRQLDGENDNRIASGGSHGWVCLYSYKVGDK
jgi:hypothetical protein